MTRVYAEQDGSRYMLLAEGHAGATDACNYITGVMYAFAGYVANAERDGRCEVYSPDRLAAARTDEVGEHRGRSRRRKLVKNLFVPW